MNTHFWSVVKRDIKIGWQGGSTSSMVVAFFIIVVTLFPLGVGPEQSVLARIAVGVIWVAALLACLWWEVSAEPLIFVFGRHTTGENADLLSSFISNDYRIHDLARIDIVGFLGRLSGVGVGALSTARASIVTSGITRLLLT